MLISLLALTTLLGADGIHGKVSGAHGEPLPACFLGLYTAQWQPLGSATAAEDGGFSLKAAAGAAVLQVQPLRKPGAAGFATFAWQPRVFMLRPEDTAPTLALPPAVNYVIAAYGPNGKLMRWKDWEANGKYGPSFLYATDSGLRAQPATCYPVYGELTDGDSGGRPTGLPAVLVEPGQEIELHALYWPTRGYGKLQLSTPVPTQGSAGSSLLINWNQALAESAIARARENAFEDPNEKDWFKPFSSELDALELHLPKPGNNLATADEAAAADDILAKALDVADRAALERARRRALFVRYGNPALSEADKTALTLKRPAFHFGAYQGSPFVAESAGGYAGEKAYTAARDGGFTLATILPAWGWVQPYVNDHAAVEQKFGPDALSKMGYAIKAHGVCWLQDFMDILPKEKRALPHDQLITAALEYQQQLLHALGGQMEIVEAINEPATTNVPNLTREEMIEFTKRAAANVAAAGKPALVNSPHEFNYGSKYDVYTVDGKPVNPYPDTFASFLDAAARAHALDDVMILGLQVYPGFHLSGNETPDFEGPCWTPAFFERMLDTYAKFHKVLHITEFSVPSSYPAGWKAGYWKKPWDETAQADYAEAIYTVAFGHPNVQAIGWWDISDEKPSVITGGLLHADLRPKPVFDRLSHFIHDASAPQPMVDGKFGGGLPAGVYTVNGKELAVLPGTQPDAK